jgi:error-prone DNA polymerase
LRLGLRQVRGLGQAAGARIVAARAQRPESLDALYAAAHLSEENARGLARAGALTGFIAERRQALWQAPPAARAALDAWLAGALAEIDPPVQLPAPSVQEELALDLRALGMTPGRHVLSHLRARLAERGAREVAALAALPEGTVVTLAGQQVVRQHPPTARGMVFLSLSDETGLANVVLTPAVYERDRAIVRAESLLWIKGIVEHRSGAVAVRARRVWPLAEVLALPMRPNDVSGRQVPPG